MSNIWISAAAHVPGVQNKSVTESNKVQATVSLSGFNYDAVVNTQGVTESNQIQAIISLPSFNYA